MKKIKKIFIIFFVFALTLCLFTISSFAAASEAIPIPDDIVGDITQHYYPYDVPNDRYSVNFASPFDYGLILTDGQRTFNLSNKIGFDFYCVPQDYARVVMSAWLNGNLYTDFTITQVYVDEVVYPSSYYSVNLDSVTGLYTFWIDFDRIGKSYRTVTVDLDVSFNGSSVPDYFSAAITVDYPDWDYEPNRTADYIMLSAGAYLRTYDYAKSVGYDAGYNAGSSGVDFENVVFSVVSAPFEAITNFLDFEILGINLKQIFAFLLSVIIIVFIVKRTKE